MNPKLKLFLLVIASTSMIFFVNLAFMAVSAIVLVSLLFGFRLHSRFVPWIKPMTFVFVLIIVVQALTFNGIMFSVAGLYYGILFSLRILILASLVFLFVETTPPSSLAKAFDFLPESVSMTLILALSLVPGVSDLAANIMNAQRSRAMNFRSPNIFSTYFPVLIPLFGKMLYRSEKMALAMQARGYGKE